MELVLLLLQEIWLLVLVDFKLLALTPPQINVHHTVIPNGQQGNGAATLYDEVSLWDKELSQSEVAEIWGGTDAVGATDGVVSNLQTSSMAANLIGYWRFETNGTVSTVGSATLSIAGDSTTSTTVP